MTLTRLGLSSIVGIMVALGPAVLANAQPGETVGVVTEIKPGRGRVEVKPAAGGDWRPAAPLLALRRGDTVRASEDALAVILLSGGRGVVRVNAASSPVVLEATAPGDGKAQKARTLVESSLGFLAATTKEAPKGLLATRGVPPPIVLSPRNCPVLPDGLVFEWVGRPRSRYTVRVLSPAGIVFERADVMGGRFPYPSSAAALAAGVRYTVQVSPDGQPPQQANFEVLDATQARTVSQELAELETALGGAPPSSLAIARGGYLASRGLVHDARETVVRALRADPEEGALYVLLGNLYERAGLLPQAAEAFEEAQSLVIRDRNR
jgi:hypothetical protein